jgi:hypothetical protein
VKAKDEDIVQIKALDCLRHHYPDVAACVIHIANQRKTSALYGSLLKRMGVKKGVPDLLFPKPQKSFHGLWIEVKTEKGRLSIEQARFIDEASHDGYFACVCFGAQDVVDTVCGYFGLPRVEVL